MNTVLLNQAIELFKATLPLDSLDVNNPWQADQWHDLYSKECQLFDCMRRMSEEELDVYRYQARVIQDEL
jgi:hypothetical protein